MTRDLTYAKIVLPSPRLFRRILAALALVDAALAPSGEGRK